MKNIFFGIGALISGILNGMLGAGGGMLIVPMLSKYGLSTKKCHATSVVIILSVCILSAVLYITSSRVTISDASPYLIWGVVGSIIGSWLLPKIKDVWIHRIFGLLMLWASYRMISS